MNCIFREKLREISNVLEPRRRHSQSSICRPASPDGQEILFRRAAGAERDGSSGSCARWPGSGSAKGLFNWAVLLGAFHYASAISPTLARPLQTTIVVFAGLDLLAAIGLWLAAAWGGVLWLLCAGLEAALPLWRGRAAPIGYVGARLNVALVAGYFTVRAGGRRANRA